MHGTDRRALDLRVLAAQTFADLRSTPAGVLLLELDDGLLNLKGQLPGVTVGPPGAVRQPLHPAVLVAAKDLVPGLAGDLELPAQPRHLLPSSRRATNRRRSSIV